MRRLVPLAVLSGAAIAGGYAPLSSWPLAILGVAGITLLVHHVGDHRTLRRAALLGYGMGLGLFGLLVNWISVLGWYVAVGLIATMALWGLVVGLGTALARRLPAWPLWTATIWSLAEYGSCRVPFGGFGWARLGIISLDTPLQGYLPFLGLAGTSFVVALCGTLLAWGVGSLLHPRDDARLPRWAPSAVAVALVGGLFAGGLGLMQHTWATPSSPRTTDSVTIGVVQGDIPGPNGIQPNYLAGSVTNNHLSETITLLARARTGQTAVPDVILWPENSMDNDPTRDAWANGVANDASLLAERPVFVGAVMYGPGKDERQTTGLWWVPGQGPVARYDKHNLVPFGEFIPYRRQLLPLFPILKEVGAQGVPGSRPNVLTVPVPGKQALPIGDIICFELAYDDTVRATVTGGAQVLVVQSNNATYTDTPQPWQQFALTRARAVELHRTITVATTNSLSGQIAPDGTVVAQASEHRPWNASFAVPRETVVTPAVRFGAALELTLVVLATLALAAGLTRPLLRRRGYAGLTDAADPADDTGDSRPPR